MARASRVDAGKRVITPGLIDPHIHSRAVGLNNTYYIPFLPPAVTDIASLQKALSAEVKKHKPGEWVQGFFMAIRDKAAPDRYDLGYHHCG